MYEDPQGQKQVKIHELKNMDDGKIMRMEILIHRIQPQRINKTYPYLPYECSGDDLRAWFGWKLLGL